MKQLLKALVLAVGAAGCADSTSPKPDVAITVSIAPGGFWTTGTCNSLSMTDTVRNASRVAIAADSVRWAMFDTTVATITSSGVLYALKPGPDTVRITAWHGGQTATAQAAFAVYNSFDPFPWHPCLVTVGMSSRTLTIGVEEELDISTYAFTADTYESPPSLTGSSLTFLDMSFVGGTPDQLFRFKSAHVGQTIIAFHGSRLPDVTDTVNVTASGTAASTSLKSYRATRARAARTLRQ